MEIVKPLMIKRIEQKDAHTFLIEWSDGLVKTYRLSELQKKCPCAGCVDEATGDRRPDAAPVDEGVRASRIVSVGRYALRIFFTSGCSNGIYSFDFLHAFSY